MTSTYKVNGTSANLTYEYIIDGSGVILGIGSNDVVKLGELTATNVDFIEATSITGVFNEVSYDGVLGL